MTINVYHETSSPEAQAALAALAEVMAGDGVTRYVARPGLHRQLMRTLLDTFTRLGPYTLYEIPTHRCLALVHGVDPLPGPSPPENENNEAPDEEALREAMRQGGVKSLLKLGLPAERAELLALVHPDRLMVMQQLETGVDEIMRGFAKEHGSLLHMHFIATAPEAQGQGLGSAMLAHLGQLADAQGKYMYLEASTPASRRLYARHGFRDVRDYQLGEEGAGGPVFHIMLRPPSVAATPPDR